MISALRTREVKERALGEPADAQDVQEPLALVRNGQ